MRTKAKATVADELSELLSAAYPGEDVDESEGLPPAGTLSVEDPISNLITKTRLAPTAREGLSYDDAPRIGYRGHDLHAVGEAPHVARTHVSEQEQERRSRIRGFVTAGHGFVVKKAGETKYVRNCSECGQPVTTDLAGCEFPEIPWDQCGCNSCSDAQALVRTKAGRPAETCSDECRKARRRRQQRERRANAKALVKV